MTPLMTSVPDRRILEPTDRLDGRQVHLRLLTTADCGKRYVDWLADPMVNRFLETRWAEQTLDGICSFVSRMSQGPENYLLAIVEKSTQLHIGNLKIGPINPWHAYADISYFVGDRRFWNKGLATDAIIVATKFAFQQLHIHRMQAGVYEGNDASSRALEKAGYIYECRFKGQLNDGQRWVDHLWYSKTPAD